MTESNNPQKLAIILTHGHFDHVDSVIKLAGQWDVPVYSHELELPYITGKKDYPEGHSKKISSKLKNLRINHLKRDV